MLSQLGHMHQQRQDSDNEADSDGAATAVMDIPKRGAIDIVKGLEKKRRLRKEKLHQKLCAKQAAKASTHPHAPPPVGAQQGDVDYDEDPLGYGDEDDFDYSDIPAARSDAHPGYISFAPPTTSDASIATRLRPAQVLPVHCREAYLARGEACYDAEVRPIDVVWTWVNGSDPLLQAAKLRAEDRFSDDDPYRPKKSPGQQRQYRYVSSLCHLGAHR